MHARQSKTKWCPDRRAFCLCDCIRVSFGTVNSIAFILEKETPKVHVLKSNYIYLLKLRIKFH
jgi:hypothetical protein